MAITAVQTAFDLPALNGTSDTITFGSPVTAGNLVIAITSTNKQISSVSDNKGNTYTQAFSTQFGSADQWVSVWYSIVGTGGSSFQVTANTGTASYFSWGIVEASASSWVAGVSVNTNTGTSTSPSSGSLGVTGNELEVAVVCMPLTAILTITEPTGYTEVYKNANNSFHPPYIPGAGVYRITTTAGTESPTWTLNNSLAWVAGIVGFQESGSPDAAPEGWQSEGSPPPRPPVRMKTEQSLLSMPVAAPPALKEGWYSDRERFSRQSRTVWVRHEQASMPLALLPRASQFAEGWYSNREKFSKQSRTVWRDEQSSQTIFVLPPAIMVSQVGVYGAYGEVGELSSQVGCYRVQNDIEGYCAWIAVGSLPDLSQTPDVFSQTLPFAVSVTPPGVGMAVANVVVVRQDVYGLRSTNQHPYSFLIDSAGNLLLGTITPPQNLRLFIRAGQKIRAIAFYPGVGSDSHPANQWLVWINTTMPDPGVDTPTIVKAVSGDILATDSATLAPGLYYVMVGLRRSADSFRSDTIYSTITVPSPPAEVVAIPSGFAGD